MRRSIARRLEVVFCNPTVIADVPTSALEIRDRTAPAMSLRRIIHRLREHNNVYCCRPIIT
jgi:hypothetical protein